MTKRIDLVIVARTAFSLFRKDAYWFCGGWPSRVTCLCPDARVFKRMILLDCRLREWRGKAGPAGAPLTNVRIVVRFGAPWNFGLVPLSRETMRLTDLDPRLRGHDGSWHG